MTPNIRSFHDPATGTFSHVVHDREGGHAAVIDPVLDFDPASARTSTGSADKLLAFVRELRLQVDWILETHAHADHLSAAMYLKRETGAKIAIGQGITQVQAHFKDVFGLGDEFATDGSQFDHLFADGERFRIGGLEGRAMATPGHTSDGLTYLIGDAAFVGDTMFDPGLGTARTDFPGGDASTLYRSIQALLALPEGTRLFLCHDYPPEGTEARAVRSIGEQRQHNVHVGGGVDEATFVQRRTERDATLAVPRLLLASLQVNIRAGALPPPDPNGVSYLRLPLNR